MKKSVICLILFGLMVSAFNMRIKNFINTEIRSVDEGVYLHLAQQLKEGSIEQYHTIEHGKELSKWIDDLPEYFSNPLFKHPPIFSYLIKFSQTIFGTGPVTAAIVPLLMGVLAIPLI